tara:strand:+ start:1204 stop:1773 length:570 start_codon:yes stop_codon:yes gene_type:complete
MTSILKTNTIQDLSSTVLLETNGSGSITTNKIGITEADQWRLSADLTTATNVVTVLSSNLERVDTSAQGYLGTGMTQSSGIFTFPSTGIWLVSYGISTSKNSAWTYLYANIETTTNNSTYTTVSRAVTSSTGTMSGYPEISSMSQTLVDVTSTSLVKVRFVYNTNVAITLQGNSNYNKTFFTFIRLGDT